MTADNTKSAPVAAAPVVAPPAQSTITRLEAQVKALLAELEVVETRAMWLWKGHEVGVIAILSFLAGAILMLVI